MDSYFVSFSVLTAFTVLFFVSVVGYEYANGKRKITVYNATVTLAAICGTAFCLFQALSHATLAYSFGHIAVGCYPFYLYKRSVGLFRSPAWKQKFSLYMTCACITFLGLAVISLFIPLEQARNIFLLFTCLAYIVMVLLDIFYSYQFNSYLKGINSIINREENEIDLVCRYGLYSSLASIVSLITAVLSSLLIVSGKPSLVASLAVPLAIYAVYAIIFRMKVAIDKLQKHRISKLSKSKTKANNIQK
jgi:hypothetical protein